MAPQHLLLASLGTTPDVVLEIVDWLNNPSLWPNSPHKFPPVTEVWVITTTRQQAELGNLKRSMESFFSTIKFLPRVAQNIADILNKNDHETMSEILYRAVLHGEAWKKGAGTSAMFTVCLAGGRKTISSTLQEAANFFEVDALFHVVSEFDDKPPQQRPRFTPNQKNKELREKNFPFVLSSTPSPWVKIRNLLWGYKNPGYPLTPETFAFAQTDFNSAAPDAHEIRQLAAKPAEHQISLVASMRELAGKTIREFLDVGLQAGTTGSFLRHDLLGLLDAAANQSEEIKALQDYCHALQEMANPQNSTLSVSVPEFATIIPRAALLAVGRKIAVDPSDAVSHWKRPKVLEISLMADGCENKRLQGISPGLWLILLRNFISNIYKYGRSEAWEQPHARIILRPQGTTRVSMVIKNKIPPDKSAEPKYQARDCRRLLNGSLDEENGKARLCLGLYTVQTIINNSNPPIAIQGPEIVEEAGDKYFSITLTLSAQ